LVSIKGRGEDIIPGGNTSIYPGDILIIITNEDRANRTQHSLEEIMGISKIETCHQYELNVSEFFDRISQFFRSKRK